MNKMGNIEHSILRNVATEDRPTFNIEHPINARRAALWALDVGCWMLNVSSSSIGGRS
jgi:hypothetical protein